MSNIHLTTTQATTKSVNNMVSCEDAVFRTRGKKLFSVYLTAFLITGFIVGLVIGFRDPICDLLNKFGLGIKSNAVQAEEVVEDEEMNFELISNNTVGVTWYDINALYFDHEYSFYYNADKATPIGINGTFPDARLKQKIEYTLRASNGKETQLFTNDKGFTEIPVKTAAGTYTLTAHIPETYISSYEAYNELYVSTIVTIKKARLDLSSAYVEFLEGHVVYDSFEHEFGWKDIVLNGTVIDKLPSDVSLIWEITDTDTYDNTNKQPVRTTNNKLVNGGEYIIDGCINVNSSSSKNYDVFGGSKTNRFSNSIFIAKQKLDNVEVKVADNFIYDGSKYMTITVKGLKKGHYYTYVNYDTFFLADDNKNISGDGITPDDTGVRKLDFSIEPKQTNQFDFKVFKDAGKYSVTIDLGRNFYTEEPIKAEFTIYKAELNLSKVQYVYFYYVKENLKTKVTTKVDGKNKEINLNYIDLVQYEGVGAPTYNGGAFFFAAKEGTIPVGASIDYVGVKHSKPDKNYVYDSELLSYLAGTLFPSTSDKLTESEVAELLVKAFPNTPIANSSSEIAELLKAGFVDAGTYAVKLHFHGRNYISKDVDKSFAIDKANISGVSLDSATFTYTEGKNFALSIKNDKLIPANSKRDESTVYTDKNGKEITEHGFQKKTNAGKYRYTVIITNDNYNTLELSAYMTINKANFKDLPTNVDAWHFKNGGKLFTPDLSKYEATLPAYTDVELLRDGKTIEGVNKLGSHNLLVKYTNDNYNTHITYVDFRIVFNPLIVIFCMVIGFILALLLLAIVLPARHRNDRILRENLIALRTQLSKERGGIVCESAAKARDKFSRKKGRLYLTPKALEFYDRAFPLNHKNFAIVPKDIIDVKAYGMYDTKLAIITRSGWRKIKVPAGTATMWKNELVNFKNVQQAYYSEVHVINPKR